MARLTTHVLDTANGKPASGVVIELFRIEAKGARTLLTCTRTNADGRTDEPLLSGEACTVGEYELVFSIGAYFADDHRAKSGPAFLNLVPIRFGISDAGGHYHVPLLVSPWSYSTYRGS